MRKIKKQLQLLVILTLLVMPLTGLAVNDVALTGIVDFQLNTIEAVPTTIYGQSGGVVTSLDVQSNYIDISLDPGSSISFNALSGNNFKVSPLPIPAGVTVSELGCLKDQITISSTVSTVITLQVTAVAPSCPTGGITVPQTPVVFPDNYSVKINQDAACTDSLSVDLTLQSDNASEVIISNDSNFVEAEWQSFTSPMIVNWQLTAGDGTKTVYVMYRSSTGSISPKISDSIEYKSDGCEVIVPEEDVPIVNLDAGDLIQGSTKAVYQYGSDKKRHIFPTLGTYQTYYGNDFSKVKKISDQTLSQISLGDNMTYNPGLKMIKIQSDPKVYAVDRGAVLRWVITEEIAQELYGSNWKGYVDDLSVAFFPDYTIGEPLVSVADFPEELLPEIIEEEREVPIVENDGCYSDIIFTDYLELDSTNVQVRPLQELLQCLGYFPADVDPTGYFGPVTEESVKKFQANHGIEAVGYVGPQTRAELNKY